MYNFNKKQGKYTFGIYPALTSTFKAAYLLML